MADGFTGISVKEEIYEKLEFVRKTTGERSVAAVVEKLANKAHARISMKDKGVLSDE